MCDYADVLATVSSVVISVAISVFFVFTLISFLLCVQVFFGISQYSFSFTRFSNLFRFLIAAVAKVKI